MPSPYLASKPMCSIIALVQNMTHFSGKQNSLQCCICLTELFKVRFHRHTNFARQVNDAHHALSRDGRTVYYCLLHKTIGFDLQIGLQPSIL